MSAFKQNRWMSVLAGAGIVTGAMLVSGPVSDPAIAAKAPVPPSWADASANVQAGQLEVPLNKSEMLTVDRAFGRVMVGNDEIADIMPITTRSIYVLGRKLGTTSLTIYDQSNRVMAVVDVAVGPDVVSLRRQMAQLLPTEKIGAHISNEAIVLTGIASNAPAIDRAVQLARTYAGEKVVNMVSVGASQQVMLEVRFSEVTRNAAKELGINHSFINNSGKVVGGIGESGLAGVPITDRAPTLRVDPYQFGTNTTPNIAEVQSSGVGNGALDLLLPTAGFGALGFVTRLGGLRISSALDALESKGLIKTLAQPTLIALSGETASFLAGGEFPIPVVQSASTIGGGAGQVTVEFKPFGVSLAFTPTVLADGVISLAVEPEVSQLDASASVRINGLTIPGLRTRRANTVLELRDGEAFAIAGLLQQDFNTSVRQIPILGSLPIIGALFRSSGFQKGETELVIVVIPHLVKPVKPEQISLPTDRVKNPSEGDLFLMGRTDKAVGTNPFQPNEGAATSTAPAPVTGAPADPAKGKGGYEY
jgi:pilus assembly protein CpaC